MMALSVACLLVLAILCLLGIVSRYYHDNWLQFVGLFGVMCWALARALQVLHGAHVNEQQLWAHVSLALFALGIAQKVWRHRGSGRDTNGAHHE